MSYRPDESKLMAYLYEELPQQEREQVEQYLAENPEAKKELDELKEVRSIMGKFPDREVAEPTFVFDNRDVVVMKKNVFEHSWFRAMVGIAASIALIILTGYFTNARVSYSDGNLSFGFGEIVPANNSNGITEEDVKSWMRQTLAENNTDLLGKIGEVENSLSEKMYQQEQKQNLAINTALNKSQQVSDAVVQKYVSQMQAENKEAIKNLFELSNTQQKQYMDAVLADFSLYLEEQRQNDLDMIATSFEGLKDNTETSQFETNQILASIITTVNNQNN